MNKLMLAFVLMFSALSGTAQLTETLHKEQIKLVMKFQETNWNNGDIRAYMDGYWQSDSLLFIGKSGPTYGWNSTLLNYLKSYPTKEKMGTLTFDLIDIDLISNSAAFVVGKWTLIRKEDGDLSGYFSLSWKRINGKWKIVADHSSSSN